MGVSFTFDGFDPSHKDSLILQGDATITESKILQLTAVDSDDNPLGARVGRVLYSAPIQLYDGHGLEASFETTFVFRISAPDDGYSSGPADGLAFFIATPDTEIPPESFGKYLGLFNNASDKVVAVEFDTFSNTEPEVGDPGYIHIGIDVNSIKSSAVGNWNWKDGEKATATVTYKAASRTLSVRASYFSNRGTPDTLTHHVDLTTQLPKKVRVGFSASTGRSTQKNEVLSWSFKSN